MNQLIIIYDKYELFLANLHYHSHSGNIQKFVEGDAEVIVKNNSLFIKKRWSDEREGVDEVIVKNTSLFIKKQNSDESEPSGKFSKSRNN